jgi:arsenite methyltransferase
MVIHSALFKKSVGSVYETETFGSLLKGIFHPGGLDLTKRAAEIAQAAAGDQVLDIACGTGAGCCLFAEAYGCTAVGIDISEKKIASAKARTKIAGLEGQASFIVSDAESLPFPEASFDLVISECSFSILPNKRQAALEISRVLRPRGRAVMTDIVLKGDNPEPEDGCLDRSQVPLFACVAGAGPLDAYVEIFEKTGLHKTTTEDHTAAFKKIAYRMALAYGDWESFLCKLCSELSLPVLESTEPHAGSCSSEQYGKIFSKAKLGYVLIGLTKS